MKKIIEIENLSKSFGNIKAVNDISFSVKEGEFFAFLGVNGAGKSTTISIICNQLKKDFGKVVIDGCDINEKSDVIKREIGVVFQNSTLDSSLSAYDNLKSRGMLYGISGKKLEEKIEYLSQILEFKSFLKQPLAKLSGGQRRRIDVARALIHDPKILILDEPTTGLDPQTRRRLWQVIHALRKDENTTVFLTTHYMEEAADADYVVILDSGKISAEGTPLELKNKYTGDFITLYESDEEKVKTLGRSYEKIKNGYRISVQDTSEATSLIIENPSVFKDYEITKGKMDDVFLAVTGKKLEGEN